MDDNFNKTTSVKDIGHALDFWDGLVKSERYEYINDGMAGVDSADSSHELMASMFRYFYPIRHKFTAWDGGLASLRKRMKDNGLDHDSILLGLDEPADKCD